MFEVLLQADRALASGDLDQAERSYWQLVELDPANAIAVTGLARISIERGDRRLARTLAAQALEMDPESVAAKRILEAVETGKDRIAAAEPSDLTLLAAQRLEALGRRRAQVVKEASATDTPEPGRAKGAGSALPDVPEEPLRARREAGRQVAESASAAATAAAQKNGAPRPRAHQALGDRARHRMMPEEIKLTLRTSDPFAAAESAAAVEAVDATDDLTIPDVTDARRHVRPATRAAEPTARDAESSSADAEATTRGTESSSADAEATTRDTETVAGPESPASDPLPFHALSPEEEAAFEAAELESAEMASAQTTQRGRDSEAGPKPKPDTSPGFTDLYELSATQREHHSEPEASEAPAAGPPARKGLLGRLRRK